MKRFIAIICSLFLVGGLFAKERMMSKVDYRVEDAVWIYNDTDEPFPADYKLDFISKTLERWNNDNNIRITKCNVSPDYCKEELGIYSYIYFSNIENFGKYETCFISDEHIYYMAGFDDNTIQLVFIEFITE